MGIPARLALFLVLTSTSCVAEFFTCENDSQCHGVAGGVCEYTGFCAAPDSSCARGYRYEKYSVSKLSGQCVELQVDLGGVDRGTQLPDQSGLDLCVGSANDSNNCGGCGIVCAAGQYCTASTCGCPAAIPDFCTADMGNFCTNAQTDVQNCGACGNACAAGQLCQAGVCIETCSTTPIFYTDCVTYCANIQIDVNNCGGCNQSCTVDENASAVSCVTGACSQLCNPGYANCGTSCCAQSVLELLAGRPALSGTADGTGTAAQFNGPQGVAVDSSGNVYVADDISTIRKITPSGVVSTFAGVAGVGGSTNGTGSAALFYNPSGLTVDGSGNVYVADMRRGLVRMITPSGVVSTIVTGYASPSDVVLEGSGKIYITGDNNVETFFAGTLSLFAGPGIGQPGSTDGTGTAAQFTDPWGITIDGSGNLYVADTGNDTIRKITPGAVVSTFAGSAGVSGTTDSVGTAARFDHPQGISIDGSGNLYVADTNNATIRKITPSGVVSTVVGTAGTTGLVLGALPAALHMPISVAVFGDTLIISDAAENAILRATKVGGF